MSYFSGETDDISGIRKRLFIISALIFLTFGVLVLRLWQLQIIHNEKYNTLSENNRIRVLPVKSPRGYIRDRNGELLVENRPEFRLNMIPDEVPEIDQLLARLDSSVSFDDDRLRERLKSTRKFKALLVKNDLSRNELAFVEENKRDLPGTFIQIEPVRYYRHGSLAAHVLGYLGEINEKELGKGVEGGYLAGDYIGKTGLEKTYEKVLKGEKGRKLVEVDAVGRELRVLSDIEPVRGSSLILTINLKLQRLAEDLLEGKRGAIVVMDPRDGQVLAYVSKPAYDPNLFANGLRKSDWQTLSHDKAHPLQDRVRQGQYPPGSVFKIVTAVAALEEDIIDPDTTFHCPGYYFSGGRRYGDWKKGGHGEIKVHRALVESCDVFFYQVGEKVGIDTLNMYARGFGLGRRTGLSIGAEKKGLIPSRSWKKKALKQVWFPGETLSAAIGQGYVLVTPLQMAVLISGVANGGVRYVPRFVLRIESPDGRVIKHFKSRVSGSIPARKSTLIIVRQALLGVVNEPHGTGAGARVSGVWAAGKTGTAQVVGLSKGSGKEADVSKENRDHAWFVAFAPYENPSLAVVVFVENAGQTGGHYAYIAKEIIEAHLKGELNINPDLVSNR